MENRQPNDSWFAAHEQNKGKSSQGQLERGAEKDCINDTSSCATSKDMVVSGIRTNVAACLDFTGISMENPDDDCKTQGKAFLGESEFASALHYPDAFQMKAEACDRSGMGLSDQRPLFGMQGNSYKQEVREQQIQQWVMKHNFSSNCLSSDCWPDKYPQASNETPKSMRQSEYAKHAEADESNEVLQPFPRTKFLFGDSQKPNLAKVNPLQHHCVSMNVETDSRVLDTSKSAVAKKRKLECLNEEKSKLMTSRKQSDLAPWYSDNIEVESICTLRQWLHRPSRLVDRTQCIDIFKQILSLVHFAHMQGVILGNVCPSSFSLSSTFQVSFLDSASIGSLSGSTDASTSGAPLQASPLDLRIGHNHIAPSSKRETGPSSKQATPSNTPNLLNIENEVEACKDDTVNKRHTSLNVLQMSTKEVSGNLDFDEYLAGQYRNFTVSSQRSSNCGMKPLYDGPRDSTDASEQKLKSKAYLEVQEGALKEGSICNLVQFEKCCSLHSVCTEERQWYVSPEEVSGATCSFASDIYCLGVLFFELFCSSSTWEEHLEIMRDLRQRIMPSGMLTNQPKEAAFCLWLLHPNPNSRPKASELLHSEILNEVSESFEERQAATNVEEAEAETELLHDFLKEVQEQKLGLLDRLVKVVSCLASDIQEVERRRSLLKHNGIVCDRPEDNQAACSEHIKKEGNDRNSVLKSMGALKGNIVEASVHELDVGICRKGIEVGKESVQRQQAPQSKCARLMNNFDQLEQVYLSMRLKFHDSQANSSTCSMQNRSCTSAGASTAITLPANSGLQNPSTVDQNSDYLGCFFDSISKYAKYSKFEVKAVVRHRDLLKGSNMICSLGFDRDQEYFAAAGVCRRIKIFDCDAILNNSTDIHYPVMEMINKSMLSSICWNSYIKSHIASSDYAGIVQLWDATTGHSFMQFKEHKKRIWSVDFSQADPTKLASGSDDGSVKLWTINQGCSIGTIKIKANVCCLQFSRDFGHMIAFGSADHKIYCYDLRSTGLPLRVLAGHKKAVSYVKFLNDNLLVSASTDGTLKLWDVSQTHLAGGTLQTSLLSYIGHTNEKNFVGLDVMDGYIACGSETNAVFAYHKSLPMPMASHKFGSVDSIIGEESEDDIGQFVSSVCWRGKLQTLLVANSMGNIKVLEMA